MNRYNQERRRTHDTISAKRLSPAAVLAYPKFLLNLNISETAKMIYVLLLDRARLSMKKEDWQDEHGRVFVRYTIQSLAEAICKSEMTVKNALKALEQQGLIYRQRQGAGIPSRIFVKVQTERKLSANKNKSKKIEKYYEDYDYEEGESL